MLRKVVNGFSHLRKYPLETITFVIAVVLITFGILNFIPLNVFGLSTSAYGNELGRMIFGLLFFIPAAAILYFFKDGLFNYRLRNKRTKVFLFWAMLDFFFLSALRIIYIGVFPPIWVVYLGLGWICISLWMEVKDKND
jgi:hypothetical protein